MSTVLNTIETELKTALEDLLQAVCGETGFAAAVRHDSGHAYPWPALDIAEANARHALTAALSTVECTDAR